MKKLKLKIYKKFINNFKINKLYKISIKKGINVFNIITKPSAKTRAFT